MHMQKTQTLGGVVGRGRTADEGGLLLLLMVGGEGMGHGWGRGGKVCE